MPDIPGFVQVGDHVDSHVCLVNNVMEIGVFNPIILHAPYAVVHENTYFTQFVRNTLNP